MAGTASSTLSEPEVFRDRRRWTNLPSHADSLAPFEPESGRQSLSPVPAPFRTVRATFTAHGSSKPGWNLPLPLPRQVSSRHGISPQMICSYFRCRYTLRIFI